jgi:hypothetical protein
MNGGEQPHANAVGQRRQANRRHRAWLFTSFDTGQNTKDIFAGLLDGRATFTIFQHERCPTSGRDHLQGYIELPQAQRRSWLSRATDPRIHWEPRRGSQSQAIDYCSKQDTRVDGPWQYGTPHHQGARTDIDALKRSSDNGDSLQALWSQHFGTMLRYHRAMASYRLVNAPSRDKKTQVYVFYGPPGSGKSGYAHRLYPNSYGKDPTHRWWDGYDSHEFVIVDDYAGAWSYEYLKNICDRYPVAVETKGGTTAFTASTIVFTSNQHPRSWYPNHPYSELERRIELIARKDSSRTEWVLERDERYTANVFNPHHTIAGLEIESNRSISRRTIGRGDDGRRCDDSGDSIESIEPNTGPEPLNIDNIDLNFLLSDNE